MEEAGIFFPIKYVMPKSFSRLARTAESGTSTLGRGLFGLQIQGHGHWIIGKMLGAP